MKRTFERNTDGVRPFSLSINQAMWILVGALGVVFVWGVHYLDL